MVYGGLKLINLYFNKIKYVELQVAVNSNLTGLTLGKHILPQNWQKSSTTI